MDSAANDKFANELKQGELQSKYDAFLAACPSPDYPADRKVMVSRFRVQVGFRDYSVELNHDCQTSFTVQRAHDIVRAIEKRHFNGSRHTAPCGFVHDIVHAVAGCEACVQVLDIAFHKFIIRIVYEQIDILLEARREVIQTAPPR